jgi:glucose dehydrogenase
MTEIAITQHPQNSGVGDAASSLVIRVAAMQWVTRSSSARGRPLMRELLARLCLSTAALLAVNAAYANDEIIKMSQNPKEWVMPTGNYANHRYSQLKQITSDNVGNLKVAWTFSTGVLRGHEGGPLVIGDINYTAGQPYVGATLSMYPPRGEDHMGNFVAWDARTGKIVWSNKEQFSVWSGALATAGNVVFYGTLEGYLKAIDAKTGMELYTFKTPSGIIGIVMTYEQNAKQYVAVLSGVGGWAGIGLAAGLTEPTAGLGAVGGYAALSNFTALGGQLTVFSLP